MDVNEDMGNKNFRGCDLKNRDFYDQDLSNADFSGADLSGALFRNTCLDGADFTSANLTGTDFRGCSLKNADIRGAILKDAALYKADLEGLISDEKTTYYKERCPLEGPFIGWKVCFGKRVVQFLVPGDARRVQGTRDEIRVDKAKVLTVKSEDLLKEYDEASSFADDDFIYRKGEMVYSGKFEEDRFSESGPGIYVWLKREEAVRYMNQED